MILMRKGAKRRKKQKQEDRASKHNSNNNNSISIFPLHPSFSFILQLNTALVCVFCFFVFLPLMSRWLLGVEKKIPTM